MGIEEFTFGQLEKKICIQKEQFLNREMRTILVCLIVNFYIVNVIECFEPFSAAGLAIAGQ